MKKKNLFNNILLASFIFILFNYSWIFQLIPVYVFNLDIENMSEATGVLLSTFSSVVLLIILFIVYRKELIAEFKKFKANFGENMDIGFKYWAIGLVCMMISNLIISNVLSGGQAANEESVQSMIGALPWMMLITAGILAPLNEELVYRKSLRPIFNNKVLYSIVSGVLFGLAHVLGTTQVWTDWLFIIPYGSLGAAFAAAYYDTDTIFTPISLHMIHNIVLVLLAII